MNAAEQRLLSNGPSGLVLDAIAADAGVSKGGLLYHFASKEALVAGLCRRMLDGFERQLGDVRTEDAEGGEEPGVHTRAYLASTVTLEGKPADNSAQLMAGILATLGTDSDQVDDVRRHFERWHARLEDDGLDVETATIVRLAADGLWLSELLGLAPLGPERGAKTLAKLVEMTRG